MADIFGRELTGYAHLEAIAAKDGLPAAKAWLKDAPRRTAMPGEHNFNMLGIGRGARVNDAEATAQGIYFLTNNLQAIQTMIEEILYTEFRLYDFLPIQTAVPDGANSYAYRVIDRFGIGRFIETGGSDAPSATISQRLVPYAVAYAGIIAEWTFEDLRNAMFGGVPLDSETMRAAIMGAMDHIEQVGLEGDATRDFQGLTNHSQIATETASETLSSMTPDEMVDFLNTQAINAIERTQEVFGRTLKQGLCFYVPLQQFRTLTTTRMADGNDLAVWQYFLKNNVWQSYTMNDPMIKPVIELNNAGAANADRMLVGFKDMRVMEMAMPIMPRTINTLQKNFGVCAPMEYKISGLNVKRPTAMRYVDGI